MRDKNNVINMKPTLGGCMCEETVINIAFFKNSVKRNKKWFRLI